MKPPNLPARVAEKFATYPASVRAPLLRLRALIFSTAAQEKVGALEETLKWGEPSYLTSESKAGSTIRMDWKPKKPGQIALYFNCQTNLVESFRTRFPDTFRYEGNRALVLDLAAPLNEKPLAACIAYALTYHRRKTAG
jgi:Domain of unknown function (DU1801)